MQSAETVLGVLCERGSRGLPCKELYRQLFNPQLYLVAYGNIYSNKGAMTPGADGETADGMTLAKIGRIVDAMRHERYRFTPVKRVYIPKKNGGKRPLGLPSWSDKLVGEVVRLLLEAYYEPQFSDRSHGFRPGLGCHTALTEISVNWTGTAWFVEGDISDCFGSLDHEVMLSILAEKIHDSRFLRLIRNMVKAGYLEDWKWNATLSGVPQGGVVSPILSNIYLHKLDQFAEKTLAPEYTRGTTRARNRAYHRIQARAVSARARGDRTAARQWRRKQLEMPSGDPQDPGYRRLRYVRYADDILLGFAGPKREAEEIKKRLTAFLHDELKLSLSQEKTLITHARSQRARFLGYEISTYHNDRKMTGKKRTVNGTIHLHVPATVIKAKCAPYLARGYPAPRHELVNDNDHTVVATFGAEYGGIVQYYLLAGDVYRLNRLHWVMQTALLRTLAVKHGSTLSKMARKYKATIETPEGPRKCIEARIERTGKRSLVARFGGIPLRRRKKAILKDRQPGQAVRPYKELTKRLLKGKCEICRQKDPGAGVHQVRKLADLARPGQPQPAWASLMAGMRRKTLIVCAACHKAIHAGSRSTLA